MRTRLDGTRLARLSGLALLPLLSGCLAGPPPLDRYDPRVREPRVGWTAFAKRQLHRLFQDHDAVCVEARKSQADPRFSDAKPWRSYWVVDAVYPTRELGPDACRGWRGMLLLGDRVAPLQLREILDERSHLSFVGAVDRILIDLAAPGRLRVDGAVAVRVYDAEDGEGTEGSPGPGGPGPSTGVPPPATLSRVTPLSRPVWGP